MLTRENYHALLVSILTRCTPERAFKKLFKDSPAAKITNPHVEEMIKLREQGWTYQAIGELFGMTNHAVFNRIKRLRRGSNV